MSSLPGGRDGIFSVGKSKAKLYDVQKQAKVISIFYDFIIYFDLIVVGKLLLDFCL